jgi:RNA polymerase sigma factor (sigma-70 family)
MSEVGISILPEATLHAFLEGCIRQERESQRKIYKHFYGFTYSIGQRYISNPDDVIEILNDTFLKVFAELHRFEKRQDSLESSFKAWIRRIMVNKCIDKLRNAKLKKNFKTEPDSQLYSVGTPEIVFSTITYQEILKCIEKLSPAYRAVFNLHVIDGFSHEEIADTLGISIGSSKSNLAKARFRLQELLSTELNYKHHEPKAKRF